MRRCLQVLACWASLSSGLPSESRFAAARFTAGNDDGSASAAACPPLYADKKLLPNGCYVSAFAYLSRFLAEHPREKGCVLNLAPRGSHGGPKAHSIAAITWQGGWWGREVRYGVFRLPCQADVDIGEERMLAVAERALQRHVEKHYKRGRVPPPLAPLPRAATRRSSVKSRCGSVTPSTQYNSFR